MHFDAKTLANNNEVGDMARGLQQVQSNLRQIVAELQKSIRGIQSNSSDFSKAFGESRRCRQGLCGCG